MEIPTYDNMKFFIKFIIEVYNRYYDIIKNFTKNMKTQHEKYTLLLKKNYDFVIKIFLSFQIPHNLYELISYLFYQLKFHLN